MSRTGMGLIAPMADDRIRRRITVHGRVQGVFFRDSLRQRANSHGVAGWASNRSDGCLEAVFEGPSYNVERLIEFAKIGPRHAEVDSVDVREEAPEGLSGFNVR